MLLGVLLCALFVCPGCLTPSDRKEWNEAVKEWNGENMKLSTDKSR
jgi:hypothetical protein